MYFFHPIYNLYFNPKSNPWLLMYNFVYIFFPFPFLFSHLIPFFYLRCLPQITILSLSSSLQHHVPLHDIFLFVRYGFFSFSSREFGFSMWVFVRSVFSSWVFVFLFAVDFNHHFHHTFSCSSLLALSFKSQYSSWSL